MGEEVESEMVRLSSLGIDLVRLKEEVPKYCSTLYVCVCVCVCVCVRAYTSPFSPR